VTFRYRVLLHRGDAGSLRIDDLYRVYAAEKGQR